MTNKYPKIYSILAINDMDDDISNGMEWLGRLRYCQADVYRSKKYGTLYLKSYNTFVASIESFLDNDGYYTSECNDMLRVVYGYTSTSAQHIAKFFADYGEARKRVYRFDRDKDGIYYRRIK